MSDLKELVVKLKNGEYDGADIMAAWIAIETLQPDNYYELYTAAMEKISQLKKENEAAHNSCFELQAEIKRLKGGGWISVDSVPENLIGNLVLACVFDRSLPDYVVHYMVAQPDGMFLWADDFSEILIDDDFYITDVMPIPDPPKIFQPKDVTK